ncbi:MAG: hypothetical protein JOZ22_22055 [Acidobacteriia bacterium]|nr:hypothetical protein [Terriglobia bacterium]
MNTVLIRGGGVAACCCARLLKLAGLEAAAAEAERPKVPAVMLSESSQKLLRDVFDARDLFSGFHQIRRRAVLWRENTEPVVLPHSAVVASEQVILERIQSLVPLAEPPALEPAWSVFAARPAPSREQHFGARLAAATAVILKSESVSDACWIESLPEGWLFLLPYDRSNGWLLSVGAPAEAMLAESRFVAGQIAETGASAGAFPSHPRIADPLGAPGWLACGTAALGFDPLCGDGAGHATREAILAAAVIRAALDGADASSVVAHYTARLMAGFQRHLEVCREFYGTGRSGPWWQQQIGDLDRGIKWTSRELSRLPAFRYRLNGFALEPVG